MKKFITVFLSLIMVFCCSAIIACKQEQDTHIHEWSTTYTEDGDRHYQTCSGCSEKNYGTHSYNSIGYCICGKAKPSGGQENPPEHTHNFNERIAKSKFIKKSATCVQKAEYYYSCECGEKGTEFFEYGELASHTPRAAVRENEVPATCKTEGSYNEVVRCSVCNEIISSTPKTINKTPHKYEDGVCTVCGYIEGLISFKTLQSTEANCVYGKVSNTTSTFSFLKEIKANSDASYIVCTDIACTVAIPSKTVNLETGDNIFYVLAECGNEVVLYTVTIRRRPIYTVTFQTDGTQVDGQLVEEDGAAVLPAETVKTGYTFENWTLDGKAVTFPYTVTGDLTFIAVFSVNSYTATFDVNGGNPLKKSEFTIVYGSPFDFPVPSRNGYTFLGWFDGETEVGENSNWTYAENKAFTAKWAVNENLSNFTFTSTETTLTITGVIDKTVTEIIIPDSVTLIGAYTFYGCHSLTSVIIGNGVTLIGNGAFKGCSRLTSVKIGSSVTSIGYEAFRDCSELTEIIIPDSVTSIGYEAFTDCSELTEIIIPDNVTLIGIYTFLGCYSLTSVIIGNGVTLIGYGAFSSCISLTSVKIGSSVTSIYDSAFSGCCGLTEIIFPDSTTEIGKSAFSGCSSLTSVKIGSSVTSIGEEAFYACRGLTEIIIPDSVTSIGYKAFRDCRGLTEIIIPDSLTYIGKSAFIGCDSLKSIFFNGTAEKWNNISVGTGNESLSDAVKYFYSETEPSLNADGTEYDGDYWHYDTDGVTPVIWKKEN